MVFNDSWAEAANSAASFSAAPTDVSLALRRTSFPSCFLFMTRACGRGERGGKEGVSSSGGPGGPSRVGKSGALAVPRCLPPSRGRLRAPQRLSSQSGPTATKAQGWRVSAEEGALSTLPSGGEGTLLAR